MPFKRCLGRLVDNVPGAMGAILADWEGEAVDQVARMDAYDLKVIGAHKGIILFHLRRIVQHLDESDLQEVVITAEKTQTVVAPITTDYFVVLTMRRGAMLGRALFEIKRCVKELRAEIA